MDIYKIVGIAVIATILATLLKSQKKEIAIILSIATGLVILLYVSLYLNNVIDTVLEISSRVNLDLSFVKIILKIISISYICEFGSQICKDAGESSIASKVELAGKVIIIYISTPIITSLLNILSDF